MHAKHSGSVMIITALVLISGVMQSVSCSEKKQVLEVERFYVYEGTTVSSGKSDPSLEELNKHEKKEYSDAKIDAWQNLVNPMN